LSYARHGTQSAKVSPRRGHVKDNARAQPRVLTAGHARAMIKFTVAFRTTHPACMARYRVEFSRDWLTGRWGFTDRLFNRLGGRETEPSHLEDAWLVEFHGTPRNLGKILSKALNIQAEDYRRFGTIFEVQEVDAPPPRVADPGQGMENR